MHISLGHRKHDVQSVRRFEDALTSMFFGTLRYMHPRLVADFFYWLLAPQLDERKKELECFLCDDLVVEMSFWPNCADAGRIEPDLLVILRRPDEAYIQFLIECKWESGKRSDHHQLLTQWEAVSPGDRRNTYHLYLVKHKPQGEKVRQDSLSNGEDKAWAKRLLLVDWLDVMDAVKRLSAPECGIQWKVTLEQWQMDIEGMFDRIGIHVFRGFKRIDESFEASTGVLFWNPFRGFEQFADTEIRSAPVVMFYEGSKLE